MEQNPAFSRSGSGVPVVGDDIEAAVNAGQITAEEGIGLMQRQMELHKEATAAALAALESKIEAPLHLAVQSVVARMTEAPSNFQCAFRTCTCAHTPRFIIGSRPSPQYSSVQLMN